MDIGMKCMEGNSASRTYDYADTYTCAVDHGLIIIFKRKNRDTLKLHNINFKI